MPVSQQTPYNAHTGNGAAATFSFTFQVLAASDLVVALAGAAQSSGYNVSGVGSPGGGSVTFTTPPASGVKVEIYRRVKLERTTDYQDNGDLLAGTVDADLDRLWMALQDVDADRDRSIKLPIGTADQTIPQNAAQRARRAVVFDAAGNVAVSASEYLTNEAALLGAVSAAAGSATAAATSASAASTSAGAAAASASAAAASAASVDIASFVKRDGTQPPTAPLTVPDATASGHAVNKGQLDAAVAAALPAGSVIWHAGSVPPSGYLKANGAAVSRAAYAALFAAIGTTFGAGDGSTTFNLPDLRGEFVRGWDDGRGVDPGRAFGSSQAAEAGSIPFSIKADDGDTGDGAMKAVAHLQINGVGENVYGWAPGETRYYSAPVLAGDAHPRNVALLACIKF